MDSIIYNKCYFDSELHFKPWGFFQILLSSENIKVKKIILKPHSKTSLQIHLKRMEFMIILEGSVIIQKHNIKYELSQHDCITIEPNVTHRIINPLNINIEILEVQTGDLIDENDIIRLEDDYKRNIIN